MAIGIYWTGSLGRCGLEEGELENLSLFREMLLLTNLWKTGAAGYLIHFKRQSLREGLRGQNTISARPVIISRGT